jgi:hypothetical protein
MTDTPIEFIRFSSDSALFVPSLIGMRPISVQLTISTWSGSRQGLGTETVDPVLQVTNGPTYDGYEVDYTYPPDGYTRCNPRFRQVTAKEIAVSNGLLRDRDICIGPLCYTYDVTFATGGYDPLSFSPPILPTMEIYFLLQGPDLPASGVRYRLLYTKTDRNVMFRLYLRAVGAL